MILFNFRFSQIKNILAFAIYISVFNLILISFLGILSIFIAISSPCIELLPKRVRMVLKRITERIYSSSSSEFISSYFFACHCCHSRIALNRDVQRLTLHLVIYQNAELVYHYRVTSIQLKNQILPECERKSIFSSKIVSSQIFMGPHGKITYESCNIARCAVCKLPGNTCENFKLNRLVSFCIYSPIANYCILEGQTVPNEEKNVQVYLSTWHEERKPPQTNLVLRSHYIRPIFDGARLKAYLLSQRLGNSLV